MSSQQDVVIVLRAVVTLRGVQKALHLTKRRTPEYARLLTAVMAMEAQLDAALEEVADQIMEHANDD
jgi:hypothetical protein